MAVTTGNEYDHITISDGTNQVVHSLKDSTARDAVIVSTTQPTEAGNKVWINETAEEEYTVPTYDEFNDLKSAFDSVNNLEDKVFSFEYSTENRPIVYSNGETAGASSVYNHTKKIDVSGYKTLVYSNITSTNSGAITGMAFYDANDVYVSGNPKVYRSTLGYVEETITVPDGVVYARFSVFQDTTTYGEFYLYGKNEIVDVISEIESNISDVLVSIPVVNSSEAKFINWKTGTTVNSENFIHTEKQDISRFKVLFYKNASSTNTSSLVGMAFYDSNDIYICGMQCVVGSGVSGYYDGYVVVPKNAVYAMFSVFSDTTTYGVFSLSGVPTLQYFDGGQWSGRKWYAYGTSLTSESSGKYAHIVARELGLTLINKGIVGAGLVTNGQLKDSVMTTSDGKTEADLITLECGANDREATLGTPLDTGDDTICGALNQCIRYLQANTNAQIVVLNSPVPITFRDNPSPPELVFPGGYTSYELNTAIENVAKVNGVYFIPASTGCGLGYSRINSSKYVVDNIHHTELGGYNLAMGMLSRLKNIPLWFSNSVSGYDNW